MTEISIDEVDHEFITGYESYLRSERKCANNSAVKYIKNFKKICMANAWLDKDPFIKYKYKAKVKQIERVYLNHEALNQ